MLLSIIKKTSFPETSFETGIDPRIFLNDFLEVLYYLKNINFIKLDGNNFSLNADLIKNEVNLLSKNKVKKFFWKKFNILDTYRQEHKKILNNEFENFCDIKQSLETLKLIKRIKDQKS